MGERFLEGLERYVWLLGLALAMIAAFGMPTFVDTTNPYTLTLAAGAMFMLGFSFGRQKRERAETERSLAEIRLGYEREDSERERVEATERVERERKAAEEAAAAEKAAQERKAKEKAEREGREAELVGIVKTMAIADKEFVTRLYFDGPVEDWLPDFEMNERHPEAYRYRFLEFESLPQMEYRWDLTKGMRSFLSRHESLLKETHEAYLKADAEEREYQEAEEKRLLEEQAARDACTGVKRTLSTGGRSVGSAGR